jgi:hypothetical protein
MEADVPISTEGNSCTPDMFRKDEKAWSEEPALRIEGSTKNAEWSWIRE